MTPHEDVGPESLAALEARLRRDLGVLEMPSKSWVPPRFLGDVRIRDVLIVGGGMCGLVAAAALKFLGIDNSVCLDQAEQGHEGPWVTSARMRTLRSPKQLTGPALGQPALTFRAWYEAQHGADAWQQLGNIPRVLWMDYLVWYRGVLALPVENECRVTAIRPRADLFFDVEVEQLASGMRSTTCARRVVLATGRDGLGGPYVPDFVRAIDRRFWAHTGEDIDFTQLAGKRVAVIGAGASAMDNAGTALEAGAASVDLFIRRSDLPRVNKFTGIGSQGVVHGFAGLSDDWKWKFLDYTLSAQTPPPRPSTLRVSQHANARFHLGSPVASVEQVGASLLVSTPHGRYEIDFLILATGFRVDLANRPELSDIGPYIRFWSDRYTPPAGMENGELASSPDLGPAFEFQEKTPGTCPALRHVYCFNYPATLSHGKVSGDIPAVSEGGQRLARGMARSLFVEDREQHFANLVAFSTPELRGDEWTDVDAPPRNAERTDAA